MEDPSQLQDMGERLINQIYEAERQYNSCCRISEITITCLCPLARILSVINLGQRAKFFAVEYIYASLLYCIACCIFHRRAKLFRVRRPSIQPSDPTLDSLILGSSFEGGKTNVVSRYNSGSSELNSSFHPVEIRHDRVQISIAYQGRAGV